MSSIFEKIIARQIPAEIVYEDEQALAFRDIHPQAPKHILVIPKKVIPRLAEATAGDEQLLGHLLITAAKVAKAEGVSETGFRIVANNGPDAGESVPHLHIHVLGGRDLKWPPG